MSDIENEHDTSQSSEENYRTDTADEREAEDQPALNEAVTQTAQQEAGSKRKLLDSGETEVATTQKRFCLPTIKTSEDWILPEQLANFFNEQCSVHMKEKELEQFMVTPTPVNINQPTKLDAFIKPMLEKRGKTLSKDNELAKIHEKLYAIMGPLGKVWAEVQKYFSAYDEETDIDPELCINNLNSTIELLGQAINSLAYERRLSVLTAVSDYKAAKIQLKDNVNTITAEREMLFGEAFRKHLKDVTKAQESAEKLFTKKKPQKPFPARPSSSFGTSSRGTGGARYQRGGGLFRGKRGKLFSVNKKSKICTSPSHHSVSTGSTHGGGFQMQEKSVISKKTGESCQETQQF